MRKKNKRAAHSGILFTNANNSVGIQGEEIWIADPREESATLLERKRFWSEWGTGGRIGAIAVCLFLAVGAFGAGMKYLEDSANQQKANRLNPSSGSSNNGSYLSSLNPFVEPPLPNPTPQLSKEYIYAGSRMLAVEDAAASAAPPADLAVWRPSTGVWYVLGGQGSAQTFYQWGGSGDKTVPGDYDGDGKTDFSVFRPSTGTWYIVKSSDGTSYSLQFGASGDEVAPADYDGDGQTDAAVFRPSTGTWYIQRSSLGFTSYLFGQSGDIPAPADYDGDGKADLGLWRGGGYTFYAIRSSDGAGQYQSITGSTSYDLPVPGDYDGDGKAEFAVKSGASWIIAYSATNQTTITWQQSGDIAVQNDYDGDGRMDIAVWRPSGTGVGNWYIRQSSHIGQSNELRQEQWGQAGDTPVPAFYRR